MANKLFTSNSVCLHTAGGDQDTGLAPQLNRDPDNDCSAVKETNIRQIKNQMEIIWKQEHIKLQKYQAKKSFVTLIGFEQAALASLEQWMVTFCNRHYQQFFLQKTNFLKKYEDRVFKAEEEQQSQIQFANEYK